MVQVNDYLISKFFTGVDLEPGQTSHPLSQMWRAQRIVLIEDTEYKDEGRLIWTDIAIYENEIRSPQESSGWIGPFESVDVAWTECNKRNIVLVTKAFDKIKDRESDLRKKLNAALDLIKCFGIVI